jgi:opacity protein-like surface antigen
MNVRTSVLAGMAIALSATVPALADGPWYVSGSVGGYFREANSGSDSFFHSDNPSFRVPGSDHFTYDPGVIGNLAVGYTVLPQVRVEAEIGYVDYTRDTLNPLTHNPNFPHLNGSTYTRVYGDDYSRFMGSVNAFYDFVPLAGFTPYIGAGIGASANNKSFGVSVGPGGSRFSSSGGSGTEGLVLVEGGVSYPLSNDLSVTASYRYIHFFDENEDIAHIVKMGIRYAF